MLAVLCSPVLAPRALQAVRAALCCSFPVDGCCPRCTLLLPQQWVVKVQRTVLTGPGVLRCLISRRRCALKPRAAANELLAAFSCHQLHHKYVPLIRVLVCGQHLSHICLRQTSYRVSDWGCTQWTDWFYCGMSHSIINRDIIKTEKSGEVAKVKLVAEVQKYLNFFVIVGVCFEAVHATDDDCDRQRCPCCALQ